MQKFLYNFEGFGKKADETSVEAGQVWVDLGGKISECVFDHHKNKEYKSSCEVIVKNTELLNSAELQKHNEIVIKTHEYPDTDAIVSAFLVRYCILEGRDAFERGIQSGGVLDILEKYASSIDQGSGKIVSEKTLYAFICCLGPDMMKTLLSGRYKKKDEIDVCEVSNFIMTVGVVVVGLVCDALINAEKSGNKIDLFHDCLDVYLGKCLDIIVSDYGLRLHTVLDYVGNRIKNNQKKYIYEKEHGQIDFTTVSLWDKCRSRTVSVKAAIWKKIPTGEDGYQFARKEGNPLTVYPYFIKGIRDGVIGINEENVSRVMIALDPEGKISSTEGNITIDDLTLLPIAEGLETLEQLEEEQLYKTDHRYRRNRSHCREGEILSRMPFNITADPWYIKEGTEDMIDSPNAKSILSYDLIVETVKNSYKGVRKYCVMDFQTTSSSESSSICLREQVHSKVKCFTSEPVDMTAWVLEMKGEVRGYDASSQKKDSTTPEHMLIAAEVDPYVLRFNNEMLKMICTDIVGRNYSRNRIANIKYLDYDTCIYTDQSLTIFITAPNTNDRKWDFDLSPLGENAIKEETILVSMLEKRLSQRLRLRKLGNSLGVHDEDVESSQDLNNKYIDLLTDIQHDDIITEHIGQELYGFFGERFGIDSLMVSIDAAVNSVVDNTRFIHDRKEQETENRQNMILGAISVLAIFSALVDGYDFITKFFTQNEGAGEKSVSDFLSFINGTHPWGLLYGILNVIALAFIVYISLPVLAIGIKVIGISYQSCCKSIIAWIKGLIGGKKK